MTEKFKNISLNPPLVLTIGFGLLILAGGLLLTLPIFSKSGESVGFINALFTAASASCVTGLVVVNTAQYWNTGGHFIILSLIQVGGLGIMTLATLFPIVTRKRIGLTSRQILKEQLNVDTFTGVIKLLKYVVIFTFSVEAIGALLLSMVFIPDYGLAKGSWFSIFHSISAFCNAGFDIIGNSIMSYKNNIIINIAIMGLITIGGLGFGVNAELLQRKKTKALSTHAKIVIAMSVILSLGGALIFMLIEYNNPETIGNDGFFSKFLQSMFQSVISRTAGFNSVDLSAIRDTSAVLMIMLMFVGGSPGSTAGGLKTTTFGVLFATMVSVIRGNDSVRIFKKRIPTETILKALALVMISLFIVMGISFLVSLSDDFLYIDILYEVVSAYATVGVTKGITPHLSDYAKLLITLAMYIGRVGPLTMAFAFGKKRVKSRIEYPDANISVG